LANLQAGHLNSMLNPLIYSRFSRDFRKAFKQILTCERERPTKKAIKSPLHFLFEILGSMLHIQVPAEHSSGSTKLHGDDRTATAACASAASIGNLSSGGPSREFQPGGMTAAQAGGGGKQRFST
jgi:hypothetical protein